MMFTKAEKVFAGVLLLVCVSLAIVGYSASPTSSPPEKVWFDAGGGDVIFEHTYHTSFSDCQDCHHDYSETENEEATEMNCRACHYWGEAREERGDDPTHTRFIGANCTECHRAMEMEVACGTCHILQGMAFEHSARVRPALPMNVTFDTKEGEVTFDHKLHLSDDVGEPCLSCHHRVEKSKEMEGRSREKSCRACHYELADILPLYDDDNHARYIGVNCTDCHGDEECEMCHKN